MPAETSILLITIVVVCSYTAVKDLFTGKVNSRLLYVASSLCFIIQLYCIIGRDQKIRLFAINLLLTTAISIMAYAFGICAAGDSKIFIFMAVSLPLDLYIKRGIVFSPVLYILALAFSFAYVYLIADTFFCVLANRDYFLKTAKAIKCREEIKNTLMRSTLVLGLNSLLGLFASYGSGVLKTIIVAFDFAIYLAYDKMKEKHRVPYTVISMLCIIISLAIGVMTFRIVVVHYIVIALIKAFGLMLHISSYRVIPSQDAAARMVLSRLTADLLIAKYGFDCLKQKRNEDMRSRLTEEEAARIRESGLDYIRVVRKIPFTVFLTLALFTYLIIGGYVNGWQDSILFS